MEDSGPNLVQPCQYFGQFAPEWIMVLKCEDTECLNFAATASA